MNSLIRATLQELETTKGGDLATWMSFADQLDDMDDPRAELARSELAVRDALQTKPRNEDRIAVARQRRDELRQVFQGTHPSQE